LSLHFFNREFKYVFGVNPGERSKLNWLELFAKALIEFILYLLFQERLMTVAILFRQIKLHYSLNLLGKKVFCDGFKVKVLHI
jgi:hypothetical protein